MNFNRIKNNQISLVIENEMNSFFSNESELKNYSQYVDINNTYGLFFEDTLCSSLSLYYIKCMIYDQVIPISIIGHVATMPEYRNQGCCKYMFHNLFKILKKKKQPFVLLYPYIYELYYKFGFSPLCWCDMLNTSLSNIKSNDEGTLLKCDVSMLEYLENIYCLYSEKLDFYEIKKKEFWQRCLSDKNKQIYIWFNKYKNPEAYVIFEISMHGSGERIMKIQELIYSSLSSLKSLLGKLKYWHPRVEKIDWELNPNIDICQIISNIQTQKIYKKITSMIRIVDVQEALNVWKPKLNKINVNIKIKDEFCPWNTGTYFINGTDENIEIKLNDSNPDFELTIQGFTKLYFGSLDKVTAINNGDLIINNQEAFEKINKKLNFQIFTKF